MHDASRNMYDIAAILELAPRSIVSSEISTHVIQCVGENCG